MKKILFCLTVLVLSVFISLSPVHAQTPDTIDLSIQVLDQSSKTDSQVSVSVTRDSSPGDVNKKYLDGQLSATFTDMPLAQFTLQLQKTGANTAPRMQVCLYRGAKTAILSASQDSADIAVAENAKNLSLGIVSTSAGRIELYNISESITGAFAAKPAEKPDYAPDDTDLKFYFAGNAGVSLNSISLKVDSGDSLPSNEDGEVYVASVLPGTHQLTAYSKSGAQIAQSHFTLSRGESTDLTNANPSNPVLAVKNNLDKLFVLAGINGNVVDIKEISTGPFDPGFQNRQDIISVKGYLVDHALKPMPSVQLSMGDYKSTTNSQGVFYLNELPLDQYQIIARDGQGKKIASSTLLMQKALSTGFKDVSLNSATLTLDGKSATVYLTLRITDDNALMLTAASDTGLIVPSPSPSAVSALGPSPAASEDQAARAKSYSYFSVYIYLFVAILVLIVLVAVVLIKLRVKNKPRH